MAGYWGESGTPVTWKNPQFVAENQRQSGGWYYNPSTNRVDRWWNSGTGPNAASSQQPQRSSQPSFDYEAIIRKQQEDRAAKEEAQKKEQEGLFNEYSTQLKGQETSEAAYKRLTEEAGIPGLQEQMGVFSESLTKLKSGLNEVEQAINERTQGKFVSEAGRARMVAQERGALTTQIARLAEAYAPLMQTLNEKRAGVGTQLQLLASDQVKQLRPIEAKINALSDRFAREMSGFDQDSQNALNLVLAKLQREQTLSDQEWQSANALLQREDEYNKQKDLLSYEASLKKSNQAAPTDPSKYFTTPGSATVQSGGGSAVVSGGGSGFSYNDWLGLGNEGNNGGGFSNASPDFWNSAVLQP